MHTNIIKILCYVLIQFHQTSENIHVSYNKPKLSSCARWDSNGITLTIPMDTAFTPRSLFIHRKNILYIADQYSSRIYLQQLNGDIKTITHLDPNFKPGALFVTNNESIYVSSSKLGIIEKWTMNANKGVRIMNISSPCLTLFVDVNNSIYCSLYLENRVMKISLSDNMYKLENVAGNGFLGSTSNTLNQPNGIFVDINFHLYIADCINNRIQLFKLGQLNGTTVAGTGAPSTITLLRPTVVFLDADGNLFIVDRAGRRIIGSSSTRFYCIIGCSDGNGVTSHQIHTVNAATFDSYGNIFVADTTTDRIRKFTLLTNIFDTGPSIQSIYTSVFTQNSQILSDVDGLFSNYYYFEAIQVNVDKTGCYNLASNSTLDVDGLIYEHIFTQLDPNINLISKDRDSYGNYQFRIKSSLEINNTYILVVRTSDTSETGPFSVIGNGPGNINFHRLNASTNMESLYTSVLTTDSPIYARSACTLPNLVYYEAIEINVIQTGYYRFSSKSTKKTYGYLYEHTFTPFNTMENLLSENGGDYNNGKFKLTARMEINTSYILIVTTHLPDIITNFSIIVSGPGNITLSRQNNTPLPVGAYYSSQLTTDNRRYGRTGCQTLHYYEAIEIHVITAGIYTFESHSNEIPHGYLYRDYFNPLNPSDNLLLQDYKSCSPYNFRLIFHLRCNITYILIVTTFLASRTSNFSIYAYGPNKITLNRINHSSAIESMYSAILTQYNQKYARVCGQSNYFYETIKITVQKNGNYSFASNSSMHTYGYIYNNNFNPFNPDENLLAYDGYGCTIYKFQFTTFLQINTTYILVITTFFPNEFGYFSIHVMGPSLVSFNRTIESHSTCSLGDRCHSYTKTIGITLDNILREVIQPRITFIKQPFIVKMSATLAMIMVCTGLINSFFSLLTFKNKDLRKNGSGMYLLALSITSFFTIFMFTIKFWFVVLTHINVFTSSWILREGCKLIETFLKFFLYLDSWLNACVAIERAFIVFKGISFNKKKSIRVARWIIFLLPFFIMITIIHEPIHRDIFTYETEIYNSPQYNTQINDSEIFETWTNESQKYETEHHFVCVTHYSDSIQNYNTASLFFHLIVQFVINLCSALFIIIEGARLRAKVQNSRAYKQHLIQQYKEHKHLIISSIILLVLALPRLIIALISGCVNPTNYVWLYLLGYFISFTPSMFTFVIFVLPSDLYRQTFKKSIQCFG